MRLEMRRANLDDDLRDLFEQYGKQVVAMALALGSNQGTGLRTHQSQLKWLMERRDLVERRVTMGMVMNVAISWTILLGIINLFHMVH
jgi:hypothetical protein